MAVELVRPTERVLSDEDLSGWLAIPSTVVSDELNRGGGMSSEIRALSQATRFVGEALTVSVMAGDNLALHVAANSAPAGVVIVVNASGHAQTAVWGEILHTVGECRRVAGVVIDGVVRDIAKLRTSKVPVFARGTSSNGPHKGWGGTINGTIQCGGVGVDAGDLVLGDDDGVVVVPKQKLSGLRQRCLARLQFEESVLKRVRAGASTLDVLGIKAGGV